MNTRHLRDRAIATLRYLRYVALVPNRVLARRLYEAGVPREDISYLRAGCEVSLRRLGIAVGPYRGTILVQNYRQAVRLTELGASFQYGEGKHLVVTTGAMRVRVQTSEELLILQEILDGGVYEFRRSRPTVVWDIGMNVGFAALHFASDQLTEVVGYEPFGDTYRCALANIALNPALVGRIRTHNCGLGYAQATVQGHFFPETRGLSGLAVRPHSEQVRSRLQEIRIEPAAAALDAIMRQYPGRAIVAKIDCEGAEYQIVRSLVESKSLRNIDAIMLEWHRLSDEGEPESLLETLTSSGFFVFPRGSFSERAGMLYAVRAGH